MHPETRPATTAIEAPRELLRVDEARARILAAFEPLPPLRLPLQEALGLVLAETIVAAENLPPFANAAMDGFAVRTADTAAATTIAPVDLPVAGEAAAGYAGENTVAPGTAIRIMTGAPLPSGADAVIRFEETEEYSETVTIRRPATPGQNIRPAGEDVAAGTPILSAGTPISAPALGLLAALGEAAVSVHPRPRVAILATGDEIVPPEATPGPGQIRDSNGPMIAAMVREAGGVPIPLGIARDTDADLRAHLAAITDVDLIITIGGVSVGDYDRVKEILQADGRIDLWQVRIKPGKPLAFGFLGDRPLIGLPGNPVAAAVAFLQFAYPAIRTLLARPDLDPPTVIARIRDRIENPDGRRHFLRVRLETDGAGYTAHLAGKPGAGRLASLVEGNGLLVIPEDLPVAEPGTVLRVQLLTPNP